MKITQRDIAESIVGIRDICKDLRSVTDGQKGSTVTIAVAPMLRHIAYLDQVANELMTLIPEDPVIVPPDDRPDRP